MRTRLKPVVGKLGAALTALVMAAALGGCATTGPEAPVPLRLLTWNIHHGEGTDGRVDLERIAGVIRRAEADLVAMQEVDQGVARTQRRDLPAELAALTGMTCVFSNNYHFQGGCYGNAVLSRLPILVWTNRHYRMVRPGEQRGLLQVTVAIGRQRLRFCSTHIDFRPDDIERFQNVTEIREVVEAEPGVPTVLAGDFNDQPDSRVHRAMAEFAPDAWELGGQGDGFTIPAGQPNRRIDYFFLSPPDRFRVLKIEVVDEPVASDHRPVWAEVQLLPE